MAPIEICDRLAGLGRSGYPVRGALEELPGRLDDPSPGVIAASRRALLGAPLSICLAPLAGDFGEAFGELRASLERSADGADWSAALEDLGRSIGERNALQGSAEIAGAGATLSARIIGALPLLMLPVGIRQMTDGIVAASVAIGVIVGVLGYRWLVRVIPSPPPEDVNATVADEVASRLDAGWSLDAALEGALTARASLQKVLRRLRLGQPGRLALSEDLPLVAVALADAERTGLPTAAALRSAAASARLDARRLFERRVQRAPVKMVVPLVACCLPSFVLIAIVPLLRGLSQPM